MFRRTKNLLNFETRTFLDHEDTKWETLTLEYNLHSLFTMFDRYRSNMDISALQRCKIHHFPLALAELRGFWLLLSCPGYNLMCIQARSCLQREKNVPANLEFRAWTIIMSSLCILNVNRPVFLIVIYPLVVSLHLPLIRADIGSAGHGLWVKWNESINVKASRGSRVSTVKHLTHD